MSSKPRMTGLLTIVTVVDVVSGNTDKLVEVLRHLTLNISKTTSHTVSVVTSITVFQSDTKQCHLHSN